MNVMRKNKDSLLAVLEAFVHDPLLNWSERMVTTAEARQNEDDDNSDIPVPSTNRPAPGGASSFVGSMMMSVLQPASAVNPDQDVIKNAKALEVIARVRDKLNGRDFQV